MAHPMFTDSFWIHHCHIVYKPHKHKIPKIDLLIDEYTSNRLIIRMHNADFQTDLSRSIAMIMYVYLDPDLFDFSKMYPIILLLSTIKVMKSPHDLLLMGLRFCKIVARNS